MFDPYDPKNLANLKPVRCRRCQSIIDYVRDGEKQWVDRCNDCNRDDMIDEINEPFMPREDA
jgi:hypothetical protein